MAGFSKYVGCTCKGSHHPNSDCGWAQHSAGYFCSGTPKRLETGTCQLPGGAEWCLHKSKLKVEASLTNQHLFRSALSKPPRISEYLRAKGHFYSSSSFNLITSWFFYIVKLLHPEYPIGWKMERPVWCTIPQQSPSILLQFYGL